MISVLDYTKGFATHGPGDLLETPSGPFRCRSAVDMPSCLPGKKETGHEEATRCIGTGIHAAYVASAQRRLTWGSRSPSASRVSTASSTSAATTTARRRFVYRQPVLVERRNWRTRRRRMCARRPISTATGAGTAASMAPARGPCISCAMTGTATCMRRAIAGSMDVDTDMDYGHGYGQPYAYQRYGDDHRYDRNYDRRDYDRDRRNNGGTYDHRDDRNYDRPDPH